MNHFLVATINKSKKFVWIHNIDEVHERMELLTENHHIYMDNEAFKMMNEKSINNRFTRVFTKQKDFDKNANTKFRLHHIDELDGVIKIKEMYEPNTKVFFIGSSEFLELCSKYASKLIVNVIDTNVETPHELSIKLTDTYSKSRMDIKPFLYDKIKKYKKTLVLKDNVYVSDNGMKIIEKATLPKDVDEKLFVDDYYFYEYRK